MYFILYNYYHNPNHLIVMRGNDDKAVGAEEGNQHLLVDMAQKLKDEGLIASFRLVKEV